MRKFPSFKGALVTLLTVFYQIEAFAFVPGTYTCDIASGWKSYEVTLKAIKLDAETAVPYAIYKSDLQTMTGIATASYHDGYERLKLGMYDLVSFKSGKPTGKCRLLRAAAASAVK